LGTESSFLRIDGGEWSAPCPSLFTLETTLGTCWKGGWMVSKPVWTVWRRELRFNEDLFYK
jgi:hypothetical protein